MSSALSFVTSILSHIRHKLTHHVPRLSHSQGGCGGPVGGDGKLGGNAGFLEDSAMQIIGQFTIFSLRPHLSLPTLHTYLGDLGGQGNTGRKGGMGEPKGVIARVIVDVRFGAKFCCHTRLPVS
jgi:hypothetical protein